MCIAVRSHTDRHGFEGRVAHHRPASDRDKFLSSAYGILQESPCGMFGSVGPWTRILGVVPDAHQDVDAGHDEVIRRLRRLSAQSPPEGMFDLEGVPLTRGRPPRRIKRRAVVAAAVASTIAALAGTTWAVTSTDPVVRTPSTDVSIPAIPTPSVSTEIDEGDAPVDPFPDDPCKGPPPFAGQDPGPPAGPGPEDQTAQRQAESDAWEAEQATCPADDEATPGPGEGRAPPAPPDDTPATPPSVSVPDLAPPVEADAPSPGPPPVPGEAGTGESAPVPASAESATRPAGVPPVAVPGTAPSDAGPPAAVGGPPPGAGPPLLEDDAMVPAEATECHGPPPKSSSCEDGPDDATGGGRPGP
jgi:hypothetical protein